ncbi:LolA family protein [Basilea psittacipulmonis]|uniref:Outer membrane lipoprotein carrier protein LolA n=1 Tax=Basilea psittacipulmonis DSM 24701 TaxID=1072685 RepID=A0A077DIH3_9BURK|nr:outer membrane lipoprotein carrier protein LolA [Basilea psittacipulmonis]AIL33267.1 hypothetical protein IX83_08120 [Basilea psittacipulmonis DSM 24701]
MKKIFLSVLLMMANSLAFAQPIQMDALSQMLKNTRTVSGDFEQIRHLKSLPIPIKSAGNFAIQQDKGLYWHMSSPIESTLRVTKNGIEELSANGSWLPASNQSKESLLLDLFNGDIESLREQFNMSLTGTSENWQLSLTPKGIILKQIFDRIEIKGSSSLESVHIFEQQGDDTIISFSKQKINQALKGAALHALE